MKLIRLLVCGGRDYADQNAVFRILDRVHAEIGIAVLIHGAARGADTLAGEWAVARGVTPLPFPAVWRLPSGVRIYSAGPARNARMLAEGKPDACVAFPGGTGTADMVRKCRAVGVKVWQPLG